MDNAVTDNKNRSRFELTEDGHTAYADYRLENGTIHIKYVFAPEALRGTGAAGRLMDGIVAAAKDGAFKIHPVCGYAVSWLRRHPEHQALLS